MTTGNQILLGSVAGTILAFLTVFITNYLTGSEMDGKTGNPEIFLILTI